MLLCSLLCAPCLVAVFAQLTQDLAHGGTGVAALSSFLELIQRYENLSQSSEHCTS